MRPRATCRFEAREAELNGLQLRVTELAAEAETAQESAQRKYEALAAALGAKKAELESTRSDLAATQARKEPHMLL